MSVPASEIKRALDLAAKVPGLYRRGEAAFLYRLARRKGNLVELGCWMGRTTAILLQAARVWGAELTTVDAFTSMPGSHKAATPERWRANLRKIGLAPPELLAMTTGQAAQVYDREIAFLFIDANHSLDAVANDLVRWTPKIKIGGVVALHDMFFPSITGVASAVAAWWEVERDGIKPRWSLVGMHDFTIAFRRLR